MRSFKILTFFVVMLFAASLVIPANNSSYMPVGVIDGQNWLSVDLPSNSTYLAEYELGKNVRVYDDTQAFNGWNLVSLIAYPNYTQNAQLGNLLLTDMNGDIINGFFMDTSKAVSPKFINSTTVAYGDRGIGNITLWNIYTNATEILPIPQGHHEFDYNPVSDTFLVMDGIDLIEFNFTGEMMPVTGDDIVEYDRDGTELWRWECNDTFAFDPDEFYLRNESRRGELDWMHDNSLYWDVDDDAIYMNVRHLDCVVKVDYTTAETAWVVGRFTGTDPGFDMYNKHGEPVDSLFYHAHACQVIGPNRFVIYDNDFWNLTRADPEVGISRMVEFVVDEVSGTANETWSWASPASYYTSAQGDAARLPNGNTVAYHQLAPEPLMVEVNQAGDIVWEMVFNITENDVGWRGQANGMQRVYWEPIIELKETVEVVPEGGTAVVTLSIWDMFRTRTARTATLTATSVDMVELSTEDFDILPHWQETEVDFDIAGLAPGSHTIQIVVENADGVEAEIAVTIEVTSNLPLYLGLAAAGIVAVVVIIFLWKKKSVA